MAQVKVTTGLVRLSYAHLFQPKEDLNGNLKYSTALLFPKTSNTAGIIKKAVHDLLDEPEVKKVFGPSPKFAHPLVHDGDEERSQDEAYKGMLYINAKANPDHKPRVIDRNLVEIIDPAEVYSGCYAQVVMNLYTYDHKGSKGIGASLLAVRKVKDGTPLSGTSVSDNDFDNSLLGDALEGAEDIW